MQQQAVACVSALVEVSDRQPCSTISDELRPCAGISAQLFTVLISVIALHRSDDVNHTVHNHSLTVSETRSPAVAQGLCDALWHLKSCKNAAQCVEELHLKSPATDE